MLLNGELSDVHCSQSIVKVNGVYEVTLLIFQHRNINHIDRLHLSTFGTSMHSMGDFLFSAQL